jgi:hypothetical protein
MDAVINEYKEHSKALLEGSTELYVLSLLVKGKVKVKLPL